MANVELRIFVREDDFRYIPAEADEEDSVTHVHLNPGDTMTWRFDNDFTIHFDHLTPLHKHEYHGDAHGRVDGGDYRLGAQVVSRGDQRRAT